MPSLGEAVTDGRIDPIGGLVEGCVIGPRKLTTSIYATTKLVVGGV